MIWAVRHNDLDANFLEIPELRNGLEVLEYLLEVGWPNSVRDPNGKIPSVHEMEIFSRLGVNKCVKSAEGDLWVNKEEDWVNSIRYYYGSGTEEAELAERLLNMDREELAQFRGDTNSWAPQEKQQESDEMHIPAAEEEETVP